MVAAIFQGVLLVMCITWKVRQSRLGIDDFGHPLGAASSLPSTIIVPITHDLDEDVLESPAFEATADHGLVSTNDESSPLLGGTKHHHEGISWWTKAIGWRR